MPSLPPLTRKKLMKALREWGFKIDSSKGKGSHYKLFSLDNKHSITVPRTLDAPHVRNTIAKFIIDSGVDFDSFIDSI